MSEQTPEPNVPQTPQTPPAAPAYQAAPAIGESSYGQAPAGPANPPAPLALAVKLMYAGAVLSLLGVIVGITQKDSMREQVVKNSPKLTPSEVDTAVTAGVVVAVVIGIIAAGLWVLNAVFNARGAKWARIMSTVLGALAVVSTIVSLVQTTTAASTVLSVIQLVLAAGILFLIWRPESSAYYAARSGTPTR